MGSKTSSEKLQAVDEDWQKGLAVVAHPDDIEYGAASAVARWTEQGKQITYLLLTRGEAGIDSIEPEETARLRSREQIDSAQVVGVTDVRFLDYSDGMLEYSLDLRQDVSQVIRDVQPEICLTLNHHPYFTDNRLNMADHRVAGNVLLDAVRDASNRWVFRELLHSGYEPWNGVEAVLVANSPHTTHAVDIDNTIKKGVESLKKHKVYLENLGTDFDPDEFLRAIAKSGGEQYASTYAAAFEVIPM